MRNKLALCALLGTLAACQNQPAEQPTATPPTAETPAAAATAASTAPPADAEAAKVRQWLVTSIEDNFNIPDKDGQNIDLENPRSIYTRQYREYKLDAIQLEFQGEEEAKAFLKKWEGPYETKYVGQGSFLFTGQDFGKVKVTKCELKERTKDQAYIFSVATRDSTYNVDGKGDIKVIKTADGYRIDDVREY
ncbi:hypothetical protein [Hymenobacter lucidus]|uniref:Lipoprotein n=1 Tax=Hymenobacter lucidus TaxID=2880930 RepID=A0ABS8ARQ2_9BACT|nr:hypothetical protein [Hymenobacter lucidus]MCB2408424.1 hypothetical protein [Hymenobacter lucidus]